MQSEVTGSHLPVYLKMNSVSEITDRNYQTISLLEDLSQLSERLDAVSYLVVFDNFSTFQGILTLKDLLLQPGGNLTDINLTKPRVSIRDPLKSVVKLMFTSGYWELPVFDGTQFIGVIAMDGIVKSALRRDRY